MSVASVRESVTTLLPWPWNTPLHFHNMAWLWELYILLILLTVIDLDGDYNDYNIINNYLNSFVLLVHINWRLYQYYFHSKFSSSLLDRKYFWAIWDPNSLNAFRLSDVSTDSPGWNSNHENLQNWKKRRTFWCYYVPETPSLYFLQLRGKKLTS